MVNTIRSPGCCSSTFQPMHVGKKPSRINLYSKWPRTVASPGHNRWLRCLLQECSLRRPLCRDPRNQIKTSSATGHPNLLDASRSNRLVPGSMARREICCWAWLAPLDHPLVTPPLVRVGSGIRALNKVPLSLSGSVRRHPRLIRAAEGRLAEIAFSDSTAAKFFVENMAANRRSACRLLIVVVLFYTSLKYGKF